MTKSTELQTSFALRLRKAMADGGFTYRELAEKTNLNIDTIRLYLNGTLDPSFRVRQLAQALGVPVHDLVGD